MQRGKLLFNGVSFMLGVITFATYVYFQQPDFYKQSSIIDKETNNINSPNNNFGNNRETSSLERELKHYRKMITEKDLQITALKEQLSGLPQLAGNNQSVNHQITANEQNKNDSGDSARLKIMNYTDFEDSMKTSFSDRFKGVVIEMTGKRLAGIKRSFSNSQDTNDWSTEYENSIANFLAENNTSGDHFLQSLRCNTSVCRIEVNTNNMDSWNNLYASMTQQSWYDSITIQESSDYPGNVIYYLPSLNN